MEMLLFTKQNIEIILKLVQSFPNDFDLGRELRKYFPTNTWVKTISNDGELGKTVRKNFGKISK